jgi:Tol biopolymer transport system component
VKAVLAALIVLAAAGAAGGAVRPFAGTIAFSADDQIFVARNAGAPARLTHDPVGVVGIAWSPDGTRLLAWRYKKVPAIAVLRADGTFVRTLATDVDGEPSWSPDGTRVAFQHQQHAGGNTGRAIYVVNADGSRLHRIASNSLPSEFLERPAWSADGRTLVYGGTDAQGHGLFTVRADGADEASPRRLIGGGKTFLAYPSWSQDGMRLAFARGSTVAVAAGDGSGARNVGVAYVQSPVWSPDGSHLAFFGRHENWVVAADGSGLRKLPGCVCRHIWPAFSQRLAWSPDSTSIAYSGGTGPGAQPLGGIYVERLDGTTRRVAFSTALQYSRPLWRA